MPVGGAVSPVSAMAPVIGGNYCTMGPSRWQLLRRGSGCRVEKLSGGLNLLCVMHCFILITVNNVENIL